MKLEERQLERLVDAIARRVEAELGRGSPPKANAGRNLPDCSACPNQARCDSPTVLGAVGEGAARIGSSTAMAGAPCGYIAPFIDHTMLKPDATKDELKHLCDEARQYGFATVCVNPANLRFVARELQGSQVKPIAVVGFPLGASLPASKAFEAREAIRQGAEEIDMVLNIGALKSRDYELVHDDIVAVVRAACPKPVKVILETAMLDHDQKVIACALAKAAGAAFVKTSTGFGPGGATVEDVALMRQVVGEEMGVKASGGVRTLDDAEKMIQAGATRIGASASVAIVQCVRTEPKKKGSSRP